MSATLRAGVVAPHVRARVREPGALGELGDVTRGLTRLVRPGDPLELAGEDDAVGHPAKVAAVPVAPVS